MADVVRVGNDGQEEVRTGLGWRKIVPGAKDEPASNIPMIDLTDMNHPDISRRRAVAKQVCNAGTTAGFLYVRNHGVPQRVMDTIFDEAKRFFHELTLEEKMKLDTTKHEEYYGYYRINLDPDQAAGPKLNESINFGYEPGSDPTGSNNENHGDNWWPEENRLPGFETRVKEYMGYMLSLGRSLLRMFALGLGMDENAFDYLATRPYSILKMGHYPASIEGSNQPSAIRPHTDYELLTILLQDDIPSLEVVSNTGSWIPVTPVPSTFVVNIGDSMSMLTNGLFVSTMHRAFNTSGRSRYSVPFFFGANPEAELKALESFVTPEKPARFQVVTSGEYIRRSLQAVYSKPNIDIRIDTIEMKA